MLDLPPALGELLNMLGFNWPMSNESALFEIGQAWIELPDAIDGVLTSAADNGKQIWEENIGPAVEAFTAWWDGEDSPAKVLSEGTVGMYLAGAGMMICAAVVLALKIAVIVQLAILAVQIAAAIAAATATFGIGAAALPALYQMGRNFISNLLQEAVMRLLA